MRVIQNEGTVSVWVSRLVHAINSNKQISGFDTQSEDLNSESPKIFGFLFNMLSSLCLISFVVRFSHVRPTTIARSSYEGASMATCLHTDDCTFIYRYRLSYRTFFIVLSNEWKIPSIEDLPQKSPHEWVMFVSLPPTKRAARQTPSERHENHNPNAHTPNKLFTWFSVHAFRMTSNETFFPFFDTHRLASAHLIFAAHIGKKSSI